MSRTAHKNGPDLAAIRKRLAAQGGQDYWRSLNEVADTEAFKTYLQQEFPEGASEWNDPVGRRKFLQVMGASLAFAGLTACTRQPTEKIVPYVRAPEQVVPGKPLYFASAISVGGFAQGVLVESHMGRPTKIEGNPQHPANMREGAEFGPTDIFAQASILNLYDPDRTQVPVFNGRPSTWTKFSGMLTTEVAKFDLDGGAGFRLLTETVTSPSLAAQIRSLLKKYPNAKWHQYTPDGRDNVREGARMAFGEVVDTQVHFDKARRILSLDADFTGYNPAGVRHARHFAAGRQVADDRKIEMNRLYVVESTPSNTGAVADHRLPLKASQIGGFARALAAALGVGRGGSAYGHDKWLNALVRDLKAHRGASLIVVGDNQPPAVHALAHAINDALGNVGRTVTYTAPVEAEPVNQMASLKDLAADMSAGNVTLLVVAGANPAYAAPSDIDFVGSLKQVPMRIHLGQSMDETGRLCHWHLPEAHALEAWSDTRAFDGTVSIVQPLIEPIYGSKSAHELVAMLSGEGAKSGYDLVKAHWQGQHTGGDFETAWQTWLHDGVVPHSALSTRAVKLTGNLGTDASAGDGVEVSFRLDPTVLDGRFANNGWLQELPKPHTRLTWDNAALIAPATAEKLGLQDEDVVQLSVNGRSVEAPVWVAPGHPIDAVTVHLGFGRTAAGRVGNGVGFNAYTLQRSDALWCAGGAALRPTGKTAKLACTQDHHAMEGRALYREVTHEHYASHPHAVREMGHEPGEDANFFNGIHTSEEGHAWGMSIDLSACNGCNACTVACQSENNIPVVGKEQVLNGREMHWLRIDRYYRGDLDNPQLVNQPVPCMQCENAPCELVCPVGATVHSAEGLNDMVYNRCVGTRYCSNNCPYKVRRFNFLHYTDETTPSLKLQRNPNVTVRGRGVMEKCTYCLQRIASARIQAKVEDRALKDGDITTACQGVCPTDAIAFGDINDANSRVSKLKAQQRNYGLLTELNTRPRTTYLARLTNPNPEIAQHG